MRDFAAAIGLILAIEGILFAGFPTAMRRALESAAKRDPARLRLIGLGLAVLGVVIVWIARRSGL